MKVALFFSRFYSLKILFENAFKEKGIEVVSIDADDFLPQWKKKIYTTITSLPNKVSGQVYKAYITEINKAYLDFVKQNKPDFIILYNNRNLHPETAKEIKKICPIYIFLGDYPLFLNNRFALETAMLCNHVFSPDSYWMEKLKNMGKKEVSYIVVGYDKLINYSFNPSNEDKAKYNSDLLFIGRGYKFSSFGYKRALFYNQFKDMDLRIYGREWEHWFNYFPALEKKYIPIKNYLSFEKVNLLSNCSKIYPIDLNPGLINGLHIRIFDAIGSGILPLVEYSKDIDTIFDNVAIPVIRDYREGPELAEYYLDHEGERQSLIAKLKNYVDSNYSPAIAVNKILDILK